MGQHSVTCPACNETLSAKTEAELISKVQQHGKEHHGLDLTEAKVKEMMAGMPAQH